MSGVAFWPVLQKQTHRIVPAKFHLRRSKNWFPISRV